jgi:hypothetical protein
LINWKVVGILSGNENKMQKSDLENEIENIRNGM